MIRSREVDTFVREHVIRRPTSLISNDLERHRTVLAERLENASVLVIGGAGTIGSHYIKAALRHRIKELCVIDANENGLTELTRDLRSSASLQVPPSYSAYPTNFGDETFSRILLNHRRFDIVANFAAHKHVRSEKDIYSISSMLTTNILHAQRLMELLCQHPPNHFFCVSTDKAAAPANIMGASKRVMEDLIMAYSGEFPVTTARFANVAFSHGSLLEGFLYRLEKRQPWSCPNDIRRYFVSATEAGELCLLTSVAADTRDIVFPKLSPTQDAMPLSQVARDLLRYLNLSPIECESEASARETMKELARSGEITCQPVYFFNTDTSGEKTCEEFFTAEETVDFTKFHNLGVIKSTSCKTRHEINIFCRHLHELLSNPKSTKQDVVALLSTWVPDFRHLETGLSLDQRM